MLRVSDLRKSFGGLKALDGLSLAAEPGKVLGLIGPNGSGKTTTINLLTGVYAASGGSVSLDGRELTGLRADSIARAGVTRTFQNLRPFAGHTVRDNVRAGQTILTKSWLTRFSAVATEEERAFRREADALLERFRLSEQAGWLAGGLSYGEKKRLELARAMAMRPRILLLDEPAAGMTPVDLEWLRGEIQAIAASGVAVVLVEHHMKLVMNVCDSIVVLNFGRPIATGTPSEIARHPAVIDAYLGATHT